MKHKTLPPDKGTPYERQATADAKWAESSRHLRHKYKGQIIAVWKRKVVAAGSTLRELQSRLGALGYHPPNAEKPFVTVIFKTKKLHFTRRGMLD